MMERRLIDANAGVELLQRMAVNYASIGRLKEAEDYATTANILKSSACFPTIDAVEVVRCRDCEYNEGIPMPVGFLYCSRTDSVVKEDDYCSYGWRA